MTKTKSVAMEFLKMMKKKIGFFFLPLCAISVRSDAHFYPNDLIGFRDVIVTDVTVIKKAIRNNQNCYGSN